MLAVGSRSRSEPPLWMQKAGYSSWKTVAASWPSADVYAPSTQRSLNGRDARLHGAGTRTNKDLRASAGNPGTWTQSLRPALTGHLGPSQAGQAAPAEAASAACGFPGVVNGTHVP